VVRRAGRSDRGRSGGPTRCPSGRSGVTRDPTRDARGENFEVSRGAGRPGEGTRGLGRRATRMPRAASARVCGQRAARRGVGAQTFRCAPVRRCFLKNF
jgi:hypothetical protein